MAEQGKADMEESIEKLQQEKRDLEQQVCMTVPISKCFVITADLMFHRY